MTWCRNSEVYGKTLSGKRCLINLMKPNFERWCDKVYNGTSIPTLNWLMWTNWWTPPDDYNFKGVVWFPTQNILFCEQTSIYAIKEKTAASRAHIDWQISLYASLQRNFSSNLFTSFSGSDCYNGTKGILLWLRVGQIVWNFANSYFWLFKHSTLGWNGKTRVLKHFTLLCTLKLLNGNFSNSVVSYQSY